jgi:CheY-like chemotaxis protein/Tfp pilus assembly protein PilZ
MHDSMALTSLIVCADAPTVQVLSRIFHDLGIQVEACGDTSLAQTRLREQHFDIVVLDCHDEPCATALVSQARNSSLHRASIIIALVDGGNRAPAIFENGANFLLYKPISRERALHSLHAARGLIRPERRVQPRIPVHVSASIAYAGKEDATATVLEINENGLGFQTVDTLPRNGKVYFQLTLPGEDPVLRFAGEVMWRDATGRVGVRFVNVPQASKRLLHRWLKEHAKSTTKSRSSLNTAATPEMSMRLSTGLGLLSASAPDRRDLSRRACCLGAEVYPADSNVPHRCTLSDISSGGCYVETTEPFPAGTVVTIVVRTLELKLCVAGKVQSMHPGFGMGIRFNLATDEERAHVQELIARAGQQTRLTR